MFEILFEGSPELGYASKGQVLEFISLRDGTFEEIDNEDIDLLDVDIDAHIESMQFSTFIFDVMGATKIPHGVEEIDELYLISDKDSPGTYFEIGMKSEEKNAEILLNLDLLNAIIDNQPEVRQFPKPNEIPGAGDLIEDFIYERKSVLAVDQTT